MGEDLQGNTQVCGRGALTPVTMATSASSPRRPVMDRVRLREVEKRRGEERGGGVKAHRVKVHTGSSSVIYRK